MSQSKCMLRVSVERKLRVMEPERPNHHTKVDAGHVRFIYKGYRYSADTPKKAKASLIQFDAEAKARRAAEKLDKEFASKVEPFPYKLHAIQGRKVVHQTNERRERTNLNRQRRVAEGQKPKRYTLRQRIVGFA